ncbi:hypothetical protein V2J09_010889 [Rumex salicifolius]
MSEVVRSSDESILPTPSLSLCLLLCTIPLWSGVCFEAVTSTSRPHKPDKQVHGSERHVEYYLLYGPKEGNTPLRTLPGYLASCLPACQPCLLYKSTLCHPSIMDWDLKLGLMRDEQPAARRRSPAGPQQVTCLVDGCTWDLNNCREYHRRHRVCERHSKTPVVLVAGEEQRFCQQCSRFHSLGEFDDAKRSCRKRLDGHNRRRRKTQPESVYINSAASGTSTQTTSILRPPPPMFHHLMRPPVLMYPPSATAWPMASPPPPFPPPPPHFGYHCEESVADFSRRSDGHIDCALSLLSTGTRVQIQQQRFHDGSSTSSNANTAAAHCYDGFQVDHHHDNDSSSNNNNGEPCRMLNNTNNINKEN